MIKKDLFVCIDVVKVSCIQVPAIDFTAHLAGLVLVEFWVVEVIDSAIHL